nr:uncharacterized protein LOC117224088 [Megalopta genalis]
MLCLKKRRTYSFTQGVCAELPRRASKDNHRYEGSLDMAITTLPRKNRNREERPSRMVLTVTEDTPADMLAGSMELLVQLPREHHQQTQRVTVPRSTPMMDLLVQIATAHKLTASSYTLQAIGERGRVLPHQPNTPIGALDALQVKLLPKQGTFVPRKAKQANQPFETTFRLQVHLPRNQLYVSRVSPKMNLGEILDEVCREKNLDRSKYELRHPGKMRSSINLHFLSFRSPIKRRKKVKLLPKQGTFVPRKAKQANQPFETTFRLQQVHLPRNQLYVSRVSPKMNLGEILDEVCREKNLDRSKYELRHPANLETLDLSLSLQDYHLQEVTLYAKQGRTLGSALSTQDIMVLHRQEERRRQQAKQGVFGFVFKKSKECSLSTDSLGGRSASPARSDETGRSTSPLQPPARPLRKRRPAPKPPVEAQPEGSEENAGDSCKDKVVISHSRNSSDSSGYHEASVLSDNPDSAGRLPETLPRRGRLPLETPRKLAQTSQSSKSLSNLASVPGTLSRGISSTSLSSTGLRKKRAAPLPPGARPLSSAISTQALERIVDSEESLTSDMDPSKPPSDIGAPSKANSDIEERPKASSDIGVTTAGAKINFAKPKSLIVDSKPGKMDIELRVRSGSINVKLPSDEGKTVPVEDAPVDVRVSRKRGKLVRSCGTIEDNAPSYSFISRNSMEQMIEEGEGTEMMRRHRSLFDPEKTKLHSKIKEYRSGLNKHDEFFESFTNKSLDLECNDSKPRSKVQKSRSFACASFTRVNESSKSVVLRETPQSFSQGSFKNQSRLIKMQTMLDLDNISADVENMPECGILESRYSPGKLHSGNYICDDRCPAKALKHSLSFQNCIKLKDTKIVSSFEKPSLLNRSFCVRSGRSDSIENRQPKLGNVSTTKCHNGSIFSSLNRDSFDDPMDCHKSNPAAPPLSNLQIFAISTKPLDIPMTTIDSIPSSVDKLPSLPIIQHNECRIESEKKLSILEPPPPGLVSREESTENWNSSVPSPFRLCITEYYYGSSYYLSLNRTLILHALQICIPCTTVLSLSLFLSLSLLFTYLLISPIGDGISFSFPLSTVGEPVPLPKPRKTSTSSNTSVKPQVLKRKLAPPSPSSRTLTASGVDHLANTPAYSSSDTTGSDASSNVLPETPASSNSVDSSRRSSARSDRTVEKLEVSSTCSTSEEEIFLTPEIDQTQASFDYDSITSGEKDGEENMMTKLPSKNESTAVDKNKQSPLTAKKATGQEKETCAVISTMPKCEHLDELVESKGSSLFKKRRAKVQASIDDASSENRYGEGAKDSRRPRIPRTASKSNDFETNPLEKQKRHLTSHVEDITFALNLNVVSNVGNLTQQPENDENVGFQSQGEGKSSCGLVAPDANLSETDVLLQKVSDTLSNSLPVSSSNQVPAKRFIAPVEAKSKKANISKETISSSAKKTLNEENSKQQNHDFTDTAIVNTSTPNLTVNSQQDTSDYVSAADEDLSIADWEYQLPAPPSAFRDSNSPVLENYDEVISSPELFRDSEHKEHVESLDNRNQSPILSQQASKNKNGVDKEVRKDVIKQEKHHTQLKSLDPNLKKVIISELETKIGTLPQNSKDFDSKKAMDISSTPKIAPIDNTLSNFTITTYTRQKSLNIFEETEKQFQEKEDERFIKSFATLSRNKNSNDEENNRATKDLGIGTLQRKTKTEDTGDRKLEPKTNTQTLHRWQSDNEKSNIQRSKSYVSVCDKSKFQETVCEDEDDKSNKNAVKMGDSGMKKATSINNISLPKSNEKFSQWRDNILKRQEEPTKEKQLQSLQVLKSILPQLKNAQQAEENVSKESNGAVLPEKTRPETTSNEHSINSNVATTCTDKKSEPETKKMPPATNTKRYIYSGPPAINLGSWSERPSHNIHMKRDTDSKLGAHKPNNRTIVNINGSRDERDGSTDCDDSARPLSVLDKSKKIEATTLERREPNELAKKLITHTTATGFKKPVLNKVHLDPKPVVTGVELKKNSPDNKQEESVIDTTPVNFKELSKAFGQDVTLRPKPKRTTLNRRSDLQIGTNFTNSEKVNGSNDEYLTNNNQDTLKSKRFTTVVGLHPQNQAPLKNGISGKDGQPLQFVKGFKLPNGVPKNQNKEPAKEFPRESSVPQPPRPPTMPVITGVTLKSARPKSMPVQIDSRDVLLESIRNFGGRENLKSATERR